MHNLNMTSASGVSPSARGALIALTCASTFCTSIHSFCSSVMKVELSAFAVVVRVLVRDLVELVERHADEEVEEEVRADHHEEHPVEDPHLGVVAHGLHAEAARVDRREHDVDPALGRGELEEREHRREGVVEVLRHDELPRAAPALAHFVRGWPGVRCARRAGSATCRSTARAPRASRRTSRSRSCCTRARPRSPSPSRSKPRPSAPSAVHAGDAGQPRALAPVSASQGLGLTRKS